MKLYSTADRLGPERFRFGNVIAESLAFATISIGLLGWVLAFVGCLITRIKVDLYPNFTWWALVFTFFLIVGVTYAVGARAQRKFQSAIVAYAAAGLVLNSLSVNSLIYTSRVSQEAASAGFILLCMVSLVWVFYFGVSTSTPQKDETYLQNSFVSHDKKVMVIFSAGDKELAAPVDVIFSARAKYSYDPARNGSDAENEANLIKGHEYPVIDDSGPWWTIFIPTAADDGEVLGVLRSAPSNYLERVVPSNDATPL